MCPFNSWRMGGELPPACPPLSGVSAWLGQSTGAALAAEAGSCEQVGRDRGEAGRGPQSGGWRGPGLEPVGHRCRGEAKAKATGMVGREKEFSVHFVPGNCQLVEVKESSRGSRGSRSEEGFSRCLGRGASGRLRATSSARGARGGAVGFVYLGALPCRGSLPASAAGSE